MEATLTKSKLNLIKSLSFGEYVNLGEYPNRNGWDAVIVKVSWGYRAMAYNRYHNNFVIVPRRGSRDVYPLHWDIQRALDGAQHRRGWTLKKCLDRIDITTN